MIEMRRMCKWGGVTRGQVAMVRSMRYQVVEEEPPGGDPVPAITHVEPISAMEYRYDGGRQRYMTRSRSPDDLLPDDLATTWHDYAGHSIHGDYTVAHQEGQQPRGDGDCGGTRCGSWRMRPCW